MGVQMPDAEIELDIFGVIPINEGIVYDVDIKKEGEEGR
jgi:hypothetical protein